jgi:predicted component of type VI protein secretion system
MTPAQPASDPTVQLIVARGRPLGKVITVTGPRFTIGRAEECQLRPHSELVSRRHAELTITPRAVQVRDLGSRSGTLVNGRAITAPTRLRDGSQLQVGPLVFTVAIQGLPAAKAARRPPSDADVASWLIADEESELPERLADIYSGDTRVGDAGPQPEAPPPPGPARREDAYPFPIIFMSCVREPTIRCGLRSPKSCPAFAQIAGPMLDRGPLQPV